MSEEKDLMTLEEVANYLRVSEKTVSNWAEKGELPGGKLGTTWRFMRSEIEKWVEDKITQEIPTVTKEKPQISAILDLGRITILDISSKKEALEKMVDMCQDIPGIRSRSELANAVFKREELMSTGIGLSIAIPHVRLNNVKDTYISVGISNKDLTDYESLDNKPVRIIVLIVAGRNQHSNYLKVLSQVSSVLKKKEVRDKLIKALSPEEIYNTIVEGAREK